MGYPEPISDEHRLLQNRQILGCCMVRLRFADLRLGLFNLTMKQATDIRNKWLETYSDIAMAEAER